VDRFPNESGFARYAGLAPIPAWSGSTIGRMRVCPFGNRQINTAIHRIAVVQLRLDCPGRAYYRRRRAEGDSGAKAVRVPIAAPVPGGVQPLTRRLRGATAARATHPPPRCPNGHTFGPNQVLVGHQACLGHGGGHTTWTRRTSDQTVYGPPLNAH